MVSRAASPAPASVPPPASPAPPSLAPPPSMIMFTSRSMYSPGHGLPQGDPLSSSVAASLLPLSALSYGAVLGGIFPDSVEDVNPEHMFYCLSRSRSRLGVIEEMLLLSGSTPYHKMAAP